MKDYDRSLGSHRSGAGVEIEEQGRQRKPSKASDYPLLVGVEVIFVNDAFLSTTMNNSIASKA